MSTGVLSQRVRRSALAIVALLATQYAMNRSSWPEELSYTKRALDYQQQQPSRLSSSSSPVQSRSLQTEEEDVVQPKPTLRVFSASRIDGAKSRRERFPTIEERVMLYMGDWYLPPCPDDASTVSSSVLFRSTQKRTNETIVQLPDYFDQKPIISQIRPDTLFVLNAESVHDCLRASAAPNASNAERNMKMYCQDAIDRMLPIVEEDAAERSSNVPTLMQFGDKRRSYEYGRVTIPYFKKFRPARTIDEINRLAHRADCITGLERWREQSKLQPIIWKLEIERHYGLIPLVAAKDIPWEQKINKAIFRGQPTGNKPLKGNPTDIEFCRSIKRCRMVYDNAQSPLVDAMLTRTIGTLPRVLSDGIQVVGPKMNVTKLLDYKAVVMMEGNDVASGLKWALLSKSVVLMPEPQFTSWTMEELLEPWVHYIPMDELGSNLEERMQWVLDNDEEARRIAERGTLWMQDLMLHEDAERDTRKVEAESLRRYRAHFRKESKVSTMS